MKKTPIEPRLAAPGLMAWLFEAPLAMVARSLPASVGAALAIVLLTNAVIFWTPLGFDTQSDGDGPISTILGPLVPFIWIVWFCAMGAAYHVTAREMGGVTRDARLIVVLAIVCALYPLYTLGFQSRWIGLIANIAIGVLTAVIAARLWTRARFGAFLLVPIIGWAGIASVWVVMSILGRPF